MTTTELIHQLRLELWNLSYAQWKTETLFSFKWWIIVACIAFFYAIWWGLAEKRRLSQILLFGSFVAVGRIVMDLIGNNAVFWSYDIRETPFAPSPFMHDFTLTPLALMIVYQYCHSWRKFLIWTAVVVGGISFIFFPILTYFHYLTLYKWNFVYSFVLILGIATISRAVLLGILNLEQSAEASSKNAVGTLSYQPAMKPLKEDNDERDNRE